VGDASLNLEMVESLLKKSIAADDSLPEAHVQLGDLYADQHQYDKSIPEYVRALELNPNLPDAHYRLGTDYVHVGQKSRRRRNSTFIRNSARSIWPKLTRRKRRSSNSYTHRSPALSPLNDGAGASAHVLSLAIATV